MRNIRLDLAFVGTSYAGWQRQKNGLAIQEIVERAIGKVTGEAAKLTGCSRTDAGVHARHFVANFQTQSTIPADRFKPALQSQLPRDILISRSRAVSESFHARRDAVGKHYRYQICFGRSPFYNDRWWQCDWQVDFDTLPPLAELIAGEHDFSGFCVRRSRKGDNRCRIERAEWRKIGRKLTFDIQGDRFLHHMVRFLVGAQLEVASGKLTAGHFRDIIRSPEDNRALYPAPPEGLYLMRVYYR
ncbi:MAG: tRNA pseudouridine(38-40) synthase TruA [bacterium]